MTIGAVVTAFRSQKLLPKTLAPLLGSSEIDKVLVINASGNDGTKELVESLGAIYLDEPYHQYNHGLSRERARKALGTDIVLMVTADARAKDSSVIKHLIRPILEGVASCAYARQIPHEGAGFFEAFPRKYNYPDTSHIRSWKDLSKWGTYSIFFSDSFSAYSQAALDRIGGFQEVLLGEDTIACAALLKNGESVAYVAEAEVYHSHNYSLLQEFQRHFDTGLARKSLQPILKELGGDTVRGKAFAKTLLKTLTHQQPYLLPYATLQLAAKWLGYQCGLRAETWPFGLKKRLSSQKFYWENKQN